jgi:uncharacterized membrane protein YkvA (DUF1232 family)
MSQDEQLYLPIPEEQLEAESPDWYERWRTRIHDWTAEHADETLADVLLLVPDFFMLLVDLARDKRVSLGTKAQILVALAYVISPADMLPEAILGAAGLVDDMGVMAVLLFSLNNIRKIDLAILREHWRGQTDPQEAITRIYNMVETNGEKFMNAEIWGAIRERFARQPADGEESRWRIPRFSRPKWLSWGDSGMDTPTDES